MSEQTESLQFRSAGAVMARMSKSPMLEIQNPETGEWLIKLEYDGTVKLSEAYNATEAAIIFWMAVTEMAKLYGHTPTHEQPIANPLTSLD